MGKSSAISLDQASESAIVDLLSAKTAPDLSRCLSSNFQRGLDQNNHCNSHVEVAGRFFD